MKTSSLDAMLSSFGLVDEKEMYIFLKKDEKEKYNKFYEKRVVLFHRLLYITGMLFLSLFGIFDIIILSENFFKLSIIRFFIIVPSPLVAWGLTYTDLYKKYHQEIVLLWGYFVAIGILVMSSYVTMPCKLLYYVGILQFFFYFCVAMKLRTLYVIIFIVLFMVTYNIIVNFFIYTPFTVIMSNNFFYLHSLLLNLFFAVLNDIKSVRNFRLNENIKNYKTLIDYFKDKELFMKALIDINLHDSNIIARSLKKTVLFFDLEWIIAYENNAKSDYVVEAGYYDKNKRGMEIDSVLRIEFIKDSIPETVNSYTVAEIKQLFRLKDEYLTCKNYFAYHFVFADKEIHFALASDKVYDNPEKFKEELAKALKLLQLNFMRN
ncbi:MAG: hypothetical protein CSB55_01095 [Candidatus Cloacimonadota bacterium]|nr:MAG: hypothetical protein CSB55_01095 [Candidatus Cloacimonadota bacterium]